jgi:hypothetical protein
LFDEEEASSISGPHEASLEAVHVVILFLKEVRSHEEFVGHW